MINKSYIVSYISCGAPLNSSLPGVCFWSYSSGQRALCGVFWTASSSLWWLPGGPVPPPEQNRPSWSVCLVCWSHGCPHAAAPTPHSVEEGAAPPQTHRTSAVWCCRRWRTGASSGSRVYSGPSYTLRWSSLSSQACCPSRHPGTGRPEHCLHPPLLRSTTSSFVLLMLSCRWLS